MILLKALRKVMGDNFLTVVYSTYHLPVVDLVTCLLFYFKNHCHDIYETWR